MKMAENRSDRRVRSENRRWTRGPERRPEKNRGKALQGSDSEKYPGIEGHEFLERKSPSFWGFRKAGIKRGS